MVNATLNPISDPRFGPNSLVLDTITQMKWLDLTLTEGVTEPGLGRKCSKEGGWRRSRRALQEFRFLRIASVNRGAVAAKGEVMRYLAELPWAPRRDPLQSCKSRSAPPFLSAPMTDT
jgi:hypothetical protein